MKVKEQTPILRYCRCRGHFSNTYVGSCMWLGTDKRVGYFPPRACLPKAAEKKHRYIAHEPLMCECGQEFIQVAVKS